MPLSQGSMAVGVGVDPDGASRKKDGPSVLALQPKPTGLFCDYLPLSNLTGIVREWSDGDHLRCQLCPKGQCGASPGGVCVVYAPGKVDRSAAALYRVRA